MGIAEELWKSTMVSFPDELPATVGGYILVYKKKQESDNFVSKVRFKIRLCEVLISFLRVYSVIFFFVGNFQELIVVRLFDLHTSETNLLKSVITPSNNTTKLWFFKNTHSSLPTIC